MLAAHRRTKVSRGQGPTTPSLAWSSLRVTSRLLGILLRHRLAFGPASWLPYQRGLLPQPNQAIHYPRKIEDLMEAISTLGEPLHETEKEGRARLAS